MTLRVRVSGSGPDIVLLHGWALHGGVWRDLAQRLSARFRVTVVDLPGHGHSRMTAGDYTLPHLAEAIAAAMPPRAIVAGWSLGGMIAMQLALDDAGRVERLILIDSTPQFVATPDWPHAMEAAVLDDFATRLRRDYQATTQGFLALQVLSADDARATLARLKQHLAAAPPPDPRALEGGLAILRHASLVEHLDDIRLPVTIIQGDHDTLVPASAARTLAERLPDADLHLIKGAGHAPFLSHQDIFASILEEAGRA